MDLTNLITLQTYIWSSLTYHIPDINRAHWSCTLQINMDLTNLITLQIYTELTSPTTLQIFPELNDHITLQIYTELTSPTILQICPELNDHITLQIYMALNALTIPHSRINKAQKSYLSFLYFLFQSPANGVFLANVRKALEAATCRSSLIK